MSISETLSPPKEHITTARAMAETIFKQSPERQIEMITEIKNRLTKQMEIKLEEIKKT
jgi:UDP-N-acetylglucosamine:LPS N-acetylglucosamine transferase